MFLCSRLYFQHLSCHMMMMMMDLVSTFLISWLPQTHLFALWDSDMNTKRPEQTRAETSQSLSVFWASRLNQRGTEQPPWTWRAVLSRPLLPSSADCSMTSCGGEMLLQLKTSSLSLFAFRGVMLAPRTSRRKVKCWFNRNNLDRRWSWSPFLSSSAAVRK